ncbi:hypothetical protein POM88_042895 [Heracleum sosnowskyi]|uniref:MORF/ORRM1/DAG-like MORF domain-containing protein n=1 Tax=Heracleum sosnowskyi TaxID=360622 RepID=A0AAD8HJB4_9APIA|nr:hypothetical protein POM88_042895 [Heracleum sosnowskyi]
MAGRLSRVLTRSNLAVSMKLASSSRVSTVRGLGPIATLPTQAQTISVRGLSSSGESLTGMDRKHWLIRINEPEGDLTRDEIINIYIKMLASVLGSEEEARKKLYSVSTRFYFGFGALISQELSSKFKEYPNVVEVLPDCYVNSYEKDYGGEPFIDGKAVPYDPKYHSSWITIQNHWQGIGIDSDDDTEEISDTDAEIPHTDAAAIADEVPTAAADEIPDTGAADEIPDTGCC